MSEYNSDCNFLMLEMIEHGNEQWEKGEKKSFLYQMPRMPKRIRTTSKLNFYLETLSIFELILIPLTKKLRDSLVLKLVIYN